VREEAQSALVAYERSGLTQREFAEREGIKFHTFTGWLKRYRPQAGKLAFAQVRVTKPVLKSELVVSLPSGLVVRGTEAAAMVELIKRLGC
jgi:transposase